MFGNLGRIGLVVGIMALGISFVPVAMADTGRVSGPPCYTDFSLGWNDVSFEEHLADGGPFKVDRGTAGVIKFWVFTPTPAGNGQFYYYFGMLDCAKKTVEEVVNCIVASGPDPIRISECLFE